VYSHDSFEKPGCSHLQLGQQQTEWNNKAKLNFSTGDLEKEIFDTDSAKQRPKRLGTSLENERRG
jgi:hypothetical protein